MVALLVAGCTSGIIERQNDATNVAIGRSYVLEPEPNYALTNDPDDVVQLTDGRIASGRLWSKQRAVGWSKRRSVSVTIDLEKNHIIGVLRLRTAADLGSGVSWPRAALVYVGTSADELSLAGSVDFGVVDPPRRYSDAWFETAPLNVLGRYVRLTIAGGSPFVFVDEIEILEGAIEVEEENAVSSGDQTLEQALVVESEANILRREARAMRDRDRWNEPAVVDSLLAAVHNPSSAPRAATDLPPWMSNGLQALLGVEANLSRRSGKSGILVRSTDPWAVEPGEIDTVGPGIELDVFGVSTERRSTDFWITNMNAEPALIALRIDDGWADGKCAAVVLRQSPVTPTARGRRVASVVLPIDPQNPVRLFPGESRRIVVTTDFSCFAAGSHVINIAVGAQPAMVRLNVTASSLILEESGSPRLTGWDYTDGSFLYASTPQNEDAIARILGGFGSISPWATSAVLSSLGSGALPSSQRLEQWLARWPDVGRYYIYLNGKPGEGHAPGTSNFRDSVVEWASHWSGVIRRLGRTPSSFSLLYLDEPRTAEQWARTLAFAEAIAQSDTGFRVVANPMASAWRGSPSFVTAGIDELILHFPELIASGDRLSWPRTLSEFEGSRGVYSTYTDVRNSDPIWLYRTMIWRCHFLNAQVVGYWSFIDTGGAGQYNEHLSNGSNYSLLAIGSRDVLPTVHLIALGEGAADVKYLESLDSLASMIDHPLSAEARELSSLIAASLERVSVNERDWWAGSRGFDPDVQRIKVLDLLERAGGLSHD